MCVKPTDKNIRTEALHMRGTQSMTTQDVFNYFKDYGPASLEWISDNSCKYLPSNSFHCFTVILLGWPI